MFFILMRRFILQSSVLLLAVSVASAQEMPAQIEDHGPLVSLETSVLSALSEEEKSWYSKFHDGIMFFDGWRTISNKILSVFPPEIVEEKKPSVQRLGIKIGAEWCRDNEMRRITTKMLQAWGSRIREAAERGARETETVLQEIETEVDSVLKNDGEAPLVTSDS